MSLYKKAKTEFQKYVRMRDADDNGWVRCCTCNTAHRWNDCDGGHFIPANATASTTYDERNCHAQCSRCNHFKSGNLIEYTLFMQSKYGNDVVHELREKSKEIKKYKTFDYKEMIAQYKKQQKEMEKIKCLT
jgi:hypothetical protein